MVLTLLSAMVYAYWHYTNGRRVRQLAEIYLRGLTGGHVTVREARFRLFGKVELKDVEVRVPGDDSPDPLFKTTKLVLLHRPWNTIFTGRLEATEIVCFEPVLTIEYYSGTGTFSNLERLGKLAAMKQGSAGKGGPVVLPPITVRRCKLRALGDPSRKSHEEVALDVSSQTIKANAPADPGNEEGGSALQLRWVRDPKTGAMTQATLTGPIRKIALVLPQVYKDALLQYFTDGQFTVTWKQQAKGQEPDRMVLSLSGAAVSLLSGPDVLNLQDVRGEIICLANRQFRIMKIAGRLASPGRGTFDLRGSLGAGEKDSSYDMTMTGTDVAIPPLKGEYAGDSDLASAMRRVKEIQETYNPSGDIHHVALTLRKEPGKSGTGEGAVRLDGLSARYKNFPYPLDDIRGDIAFTEDTVTFGSLKGSRGSVVFTIWGWIKGLSGKETYDVTIKSENLPMDKTLKESLQPTARNLFENLSPAGSANVETRIWRNAGEPEKVTLTFLEGASLTTMHKFFPYRVDITGGCFHVKGSEVVIPGPGQGAGDPEMQKGQPISARRGQAGLVIYGHATRLDTDKPDSDFTIEADNLPLDADLAAALEPQAKAALADLNAAGTLKNIKARVRQSGDEKADFDVSARLEKMSFKYKAFPYAVEEAACDLTIGPDRVVIRDLAGKHGPTSIKLNGQVYLSQKEGGADLSMEISNLVFDDELRAALGPGVREMWKQVAPGGTADVIVNKFEDNTPKNPGKLDYEVTVRPREMTLGYAGMPYRFRIGRKDQADTEPADAARPEGVIVATPGKVVIRRLKSVPSPKEPSLELLDGTISYNDRTVEAELTVKASNLALNAECLELLRKEEVPLAARLSPGGSFEIDLEKIKVVRTLPAPGPRQAEGAAATRPALAGRTDISVSGSVTLKEAVVGFGLTQTKVSGVIKGSISNSEKGLAIDGQLVGLELLVDGKRRLGDVNAQFKRRPGDPLQIDKIAGKAYGGLLEGRAIVSLEKPTNYRLRVTFEALKLEDLLEGGGKKPEIQGLVDGSMEMSGTAGDVAGRQASGQLRITKAKLVELPVLLSLVQVVTLSLPKEGPYVHGFVDYHMQGSTVVFREIYLGGTGASLVGSGKMDTKTRKLNLTFLSGSRALPRLAAIGELVQGILGEIAEIKLTGTLEKPEIEPVPLRSLQDIIKILTRPEQAET